MGFRKIQEKFENIDLRLFSAFQDLHRTGCSLFCGEDAHANQLMLKRVLLAYARWNKSIGYCQGFNMLAAIILEESTNLTYTTSAPFEGCCWAVAALYWHPMKSKDMGPMGPILS